MKFKTRLEELRNEKNLNQSEIATAINISRVQYNQYENNYYSIPIKHLINICDYYNVSLDYILNLTDIRNYDNKEYNIERNIAGERLKNFRKENV